MADTVRRTFRSLNAIDEPVTDVAGLFRFLWSAIGVGPLFLYAAKRESLKLQGKFLTIP